MAKIGFLGIGNMGYAMLVGASRVFDKSDLIYTDVNADRLSFVNTETGIDFVGSNKECVENSKYVVLAVKPQYYQQALDSIKPFINREHIIISIAPGITIDSLKKALSDDIRIIRAMPNTPALVSEGMSVISYSNDEYTDDERETVKAFFESFGQLLEVEERLMDSVVPISGSSPAYVYMFIEALADGAVRLGLPRDKAYILAAQSVLGSAKMVLETGEHPGSLKDKVCSPGGTTIEAVAALEQRGFRSAILQAVDSCYKKCKEIK